MECKSRSWSLVTLTCSIHASALRPSWMCKRFARVPTNKNIEYGDHSMLKGFNYPLTPKGKSTLNPPPPWYYSADFLNVEFWSDPAAVAAVLPHGLDPDTAPKGHGKALFYDWQFTGANDEYLDPARYQYREFFLLFDALFEGKPVTFCPYIFVDNDAAIARGWTQGYPKRLGRVFQTRYYAATGKAGPALAPGSKFAGSLTARGRRRAQALGTLKGPILARAAPKN